MSDSTLNSSLLIRVQLHDSAAWQRLVQLYEPVILKWARKAGLRDADAADVVQEVMRAVMRAIGNFCRDQPGDTFRGWLWTITRNKILDWRRGQEQQALATGGTAAFLQLHELPETPAESEAGTENFAIFCKALELLKLDFQPQTWTAFWRVAIENASPDEVAAELNISRNSVYVAKNRCLKRLREELANLVEIDGFWPKGVKE